MFMATTKAQDWAKLQKETQDKKPIFEVDIDAQDSWGKSAGQDAEETQKDVVAEVSDLGDLEIKQEFTLSPADAVKFAHWILATF